MKLAEIKGPYNAIFSLGKKCLASIQLDKNQLRPYSGVLDWMLSDNLASVNLLLQNRFASFMELPNMVLEQAEHGTLFRDHAYDILLVHDLPLDGNGVHDVQQFGHFKDKLNRRIHRFVEKAATSPMILYIRLGGSYAEAQQLQTVLSELVTYDFRILLINHTPIYTIIDNEWALDKVCSIQIPLDLECDDLWRVILYGITLHLG